MCLCTFYIYHCLSYHLINRIKNPSPVENESDDDNDTSNRIRNVDGIDVGIDSDISSDDEKIEITSTDVSDPSIDPTDPSIESSNTSNTSKSGNLQVESITRTCSPDGNSTRQSVYGITSQPNGVHVNKPVNTKRRHQWTSIQDKFIRYVIQSNY